MRILTALSAVAFFLSGCTTVQEIAVRQPADVGPPPGGTPTAGAACVDITPPPGMPMGGYSLLANKGQGFRTRIKARAVYLNDGKGHSVALVQLDLAAGSLLLHHLVSERVAEQTGLRPGDIAAPVCVSFGGVEPDPDAVEEVVELAREEGDPCPDCAHTDHPGTYVGIDTREPCRTCGGSAYVAGGAQ